MATPYDPGRPRFESIFAPFLILLFTHVNMGFAEQVFNYTEKTTTCQDLGCANNNVCHASTSNETQTAQVYCQCRGQWAGIRCQSQLEVTESTASTSTATLRIRGITPSIPRKMVPLADLYIKEFSVSFWNMNGSEGCSIIRLNTITPSVTVKGLDKNETYMFCVANGANVDSCRLKSTDSVNVLKKSNCVSVKTQSQQKQSIDFGLIIVPGFIVFFLIILFTILYIKRRSLFVQFILNFCCCRKCYCLKKRTIRKKQHVIRQKHRNISGAVLLPSDGNSPFDDTTSFTPSYVSNSQSSSAFGNRSSIISDDKFPAFLEETPNPLYNPNVVSNLEFQTSPDCNIGFHFVGDEFHTIGNNTLSSHGLDSLHNTFRATLDHTSYSNNYMNHNHNSNPNNAPDILSNHINYANSNNTQFPLHLKPVRQNSLPVHTSFNDNYHVNSFLSPTTPYSAMNQPSFIVPNGKIQSQCSWPSEGKSPPGAVRVFPHDKDWNQRRDYQGFKPSRNRYSISTIDDSLKRIEKRRRPIIRRRPLSYDLDYLYRHQTTDSYTDDMLLGVTTTTPIPSHEAFAVATLPRSHQTGRGQQCSPRRMNSLVKSPSDTFYSINTLPHETKLLYPQSFTDTIPNGTVLKEDNQSVYNYPDSNMSKDSKTDQPQIKKRVKNLITQFERTLPFLNHHQAGRNSKFCDDEYFRDFVSPLALERKQRRNTRRKGKSRPMSHPGLFEVRTMGHIEPPVIGVDSIFQGHPSQHVLPPFSSDVVGETIDEINTNDGVTADTGSVSVYESENDALITPKAPSIALHKNDKDKYVISAFNEELPNLVTPFILKKGSSEESIDTFNVTSALTDCVKQWN